MSNLASSSLFRAVVGSRLHECEFVVFFDCAAGRLPAAYISDLLAHVWQVTTTDLDVYNVWSERELLDQAITSSAAGDLRLFETGAYQGHPMFADPSRTLFLVRPPTQMRLAAAQILLPIVTKACPA